MWREFKEFALKGDVMDLAVGLVIGAAFGKIVNSLVNDVLMPPIGFLLGRTDFANFFVALSTQSYPTVAAAKVAGVPTINVGLFLQTVTEFFIVAFAIFLVVRQVNRWRRAPQAK